MNEVTIRKGQVWSVDIIISAGPACSSGSTDTLLARSREFILVLEVHPEARIVKVLTESAGRIFLNMAAFSPGPGSGTVYTLVSEDTNE